MSLPTLAKVGTFQFYKSAKVPENLKDWPNTMKAVEIIIKILKMKLNGDTGKRSAWGIDTTAKLSKMYFLRGRTGSGKSTFMIQELYKNIIVGSGCRLYCTEPRVVLTKANPTDILRYNKSWKFGVNVGVSSGQEVIKPISRESFTFCTTQKMNDLLVSIFKINDVERQKQVLRRIKIIVVDECHELDAPMMALLKTIWDVINRFGALKECPLFIFSSATIDAEKMLKYYATAAGVDESKINTLFENAYLIGEVLGEANNPVRVKFVDSSEMNALCQRESENKDRGYGFMILAEWFWNHYGKTLFETKDFLTVDGAKIACRDVLLFIPLVSGIEIVGQYLKDKISTMYPCFVVGKGCLMNTVEAWRAKFRNRKRVMYVGFGRNYSPAGDSILAYSLEPNPEVRENEIKIIGSTSVIETGKTISTLHLCINMGLETTTLYNPLSFEFKHMLEYLKQIPCSKDQVTQRMGRVGRECPGEFVHFYSEQAYELFQQSKTAETVNSACLSAFVLNDMFVNYKCGKYVDTFNMNGYYWPTSTDILIKSTTDLVNAGFLTGLGQFCMLRTKSSQNWVMYAKWLFYIKGWSLWDALLLGAANRKSLPPSFVVEGIEPRNLKYQNLNFETSDEMSEIVKLARNFMTEVVYGNDLRFKSSEMRLFKPLSDEMGYRPPPSRDEGDKKNDEGDRVRRGRCLLDDVGDDVGDDVDGLFIMNLTSNRL